MIQRKDPDEVACKPTEAWFCEGCRKKNIPAKGAVSLQEKTCYGKTYITSCNCYDECVGARWFCDHCDAAKGDYPNVWGAEDSRHFCALTRATYQKTCSCDQSCIWQPWYCDACKKKTTGPNKLYQYCASDDSYYNVSCAACSLPYCLSSSHSGLSTFQKKTKCSSDGVPGLEASVSVYECYKLCMNKGGGCCQWNTENRQCRFWRCELEPQVIDAANENEGAFMTSVCGAASCTSSL